jgi:hypothetical protein
MSGADFSIPIDSGAYSDTPRDPSRTAEEIGKALLDAFNVLPKIAEWLGFPQWLSHPLQTIEDEITYLVGETEYYGALPMSLILGGSAIYFLRKGRRAPVLS